MEFSPNSTFLFVVAACVILFVIAQSLFFLIRAYKRAKDLGMDMAQIKKTIEVNLCGMVRAHGNS